MGSSPSLRNSPARPCWWAAAWLAAQVACTIDARSESAFDRISLPSPTRSAAAPFLRVESIRELSSSSVVLLDSYERAIFWLDSAVSSARLIGRHGLGPGEYMLPFKLLPMRGDTTALLDAVGRKVLLLGPAGRFAGYLDGYCRPNPVAEAKPLSGFEYVVQAMDTLGHCYGLGPPLRIGVNGRLELTDSAAILRWLPGGASRDTLAFLEMVSSLPRSVNNGRAYTIGRKPSPLLKTSQWAVSLDGTIAMIHPEPYRVDLVFPDGYRRHGPDLPFEPVRVTPWHKQQVLAQARRLHPQLWYSVGGEGQRVVMGRTPLREPIVWPRHLPPFPAEPVQFDSRGMLWIRRWAGGDPWTTYDVIDHRGRLAGRFKLQPGHRLVGFGRSWIYTVRIDANDFEYLERRPMPHINPRP